MRLGIVSDIHCNIDALDQAVKRMGPIDELLCAGDACYQFRFSNAVAERLQALGAKYVLGNHEDILLSPDGIRAQQSDKVNQDLLEWTRGIPHYLRTQVNGKRLLMFHATPWPPYKDYLYPSSPELERLSQEDARLHHLRPHALPVAAPHWPRPGDQSRVHGGTARPEQWVPTLLCGAGHANG